ncbi:oligosaccharide flippase family protein [bacterium]|nr:oligosaccharide flippase family protein [bacterium]RQV97460.1 MAG: hypothetical protein EH221_03720 [bacterium]
MLQSIKKLTRHSAVYGIGHIVSRFLGFLLMPIHTNVFLPEEYRTPTLLFAALAILNVIFSYGLDSAFLRFFIIEDSVKKKYNIFSTAFWMILGTGVCFSSIMIFNPAPFSNIIFRSAEHTTLIRLAGGILLADALCLLPFLVLRAEEQSTRFIILRSLNIIVNLVLNILFVVILRKGIESIFVANLATSLFTLFLVMPIIFHWLRFVFQKTILTELLRFGLPYIPSGMAVLIMDKIGNFFIDRMVGPEATGIYSAGCKLGMFMALVVAGFRFAWHPFFLSTSKQEDAQQIFARVLTYFLLVTGFLFLVISYFIKEIVGFQISGIGLIGRDYIAGIDIVPLVMLAYIGYGVYTNFVVGIYLKKKTIYLPIVTGIGALVSILSNLLLIPGLGITGAAWAIFLAYASMASALYILSKRLYPIPYEGRRIIKVLLIFGALFFIEHWLIGEEHVVYRIGLLLMAFPLLSVVKFYNIEERSSIKRIFRRSFG